MESRSPKCGIASLDYFEKSRSRLFVSTSDYYYFCVCVCHKTSRSELFHYTIGGRKFFCSISYFHNDKCTYTHVCACVYALCIYINMYVCMSVCMHAWTPNTLSQKTSETCMCSYLNFINLIKCP